jgi:serine/threonine protein phosphatase 1
MKLFRRSQAAPDVPAGAGIPPGHRIYCFGDIHGRLDLLLQRRALIEADLRAAPVEQAATIFLGDYIDRGPDSAGVLELLASADFPTSVFALRGNHEQMALEFLADPVAAPGWLRFGGFETLHSYGVDNGSAISPDELLRLRDALAQALPANHRSFLESTSASAECGDYFFCHAGVRPGIALAEQSVEDLLWIRDAFLNDDRRHPKIVVHGHTPVEAPDIRPNRINLDTGAYVTGQLTCLVLDGSTRRLLGN